MQHAREMGFHTALQVTPELMDEARQGGFTLHDHVGDGPTWCRWIRTPKIPARWTN